VRRAIPAAVAVAITVVVVVALMLRARGEDPPVDRATAVLGREAAFDSSTESVQSFALVYQHLVDATKAFPKDCDVDAGKGRCLALNQAAAWALSFSPAAGHCTQPSVQEGRLALLAYVERSQRLADDAPEPPPLPPIPTC
jgi:hypothetical protein